MTHETRCSACKGHPAVVWEALCPIHALYVEPEMLGGLHLLADPDEPLEQAG